MGKAVAVGAGVAALLASTYFLLGPDGKKNQSKTKEWMIKMKKDVAKKLKQAKNITEPAYNKIVDTVAKTYAVAGKLDKKEILQLAQDIKAQWTKINKVVKTTKGRTIAVKKSHKKVLHKGK